MKRKVVFWTVQQLMDNSDRINLPGRNGPHLWSSDAENRVVDSIVRGFDIGPLYFYHHRDGTYECLDGRSRILSIRSYMGGNRLFWQSLHPKLSGRTYNQIKVMGTESAFEFRKLVEDYYITVVVLSDVDQDADELDQQLMRLNIGFLPIQKVAYMVGDARDECFWKLDRHPYLAAVDTSVESLMRGYVAGQILRQAFSLGRSGTFGAVRYTDVMKFFKEKSEFDDNDKQVCDKTHRLMDLLAEHFQEGEFGNPALLISLFLFAWRNGVECEDKARYVVGFARDVMYRISVNQILDIPIDDKYNATREFSHNLSHISERRENISGRDHALDQLFGRFKQMNTFKHKLEEAHDPNGPESRPS